jgi:hypothetical protein
MSESKVLRPFVLALALASLLATACGPAMQVIRVYSDPPGADVLLKGTVVATTPAQVKVSKKETGLSLRIEKEGYKPVDVLLRRSFDPWFVPKSCGLGLLLGGLYGAQAMLKEHGVLTLGGFAGSVAGGVTVFGVDLVDGFAEGGAYKLSPCEISVGLNKQ